MITIADRLTLVGTSHISEQSVQQVRSAIETTKPTLVAVELDVGRFQALQTQSPRGRPPLRLMRELGVTGYVFLLFASWAQQQLGRVVKLTPGSEMIAAIRVAQKQDIPIAFIDRDIRITLSRVSRFLTWRERFRFLRDIVRGLLFPRSQMRKLGIEDLDLRKVPEERVIKAMLMGFKKDYPTLYKVLVHERDVYMARKLFFLLQADPTRRIVAVVGAGHETDIAELLRRALGGKADFAP